MTVFLRRLAIRAADVFADAITAVVFRGVKQK